MREKLRKLQQELLEQLEIALDGDMEVADALEESNDALSRAIEALPTPCPNAQHSERRNRAGR